MGQAVFESCVYGYEAEAQPSREDSCVSPCQDATRQKRIVVKELQSMGDGLNARYFFANALYNAVRDFGPRDFAGALLTGLQSVVVLKILIS